MLAQTFGVINVWTYLAGVIVIILLPGPNSLYVLSVAAQKGVRTGYRGACGVFLGDTILMTLSAAGVTSLLKANPMVFFAVKYAGAAYLLYMGTGMLRAAWRKTRGREADLGNGPAMQHVDASRPFSKALVISLLNPKAILFFVSFFIQFVDPAFAHPALAFVVLGAICQFFSFLYLSTLILAGARLAEHFRRRRRLSAGATGGVGALFVGFGLKLAAATLS